MFCIVFLEENNFTTKGAPPTHSSYTRNHHNSIFGEMGLIDQLPRSATVRALEDCSISIMTPDTFNSLAKRNPKALMPILKVLAKRLRNTLKVIEEVDEQKPHSQAVVAGNI